MSAWLMHWMNTVWMLWLHLAAQCVPFHDLCVVCRPIFEVWSRKKPLRGKPCTRKKLVEGNVWKCLFHFYFTTLFARTSEIKLPEFVNKIALERRNFLKTFPGHNTLDTLKPSCTREFWVVCLPPRQLCLALFVGWHSFYQLVSQFRSVYSVVHETSASKVFQKIDTNLIWPNFLSDVDPGMGVERPETNSFGGGLVNS